MCQKSPIFTHPTCIRRPRSRLLRLNFAEIFVPKIKLRWQQEKGSDIDTYITTSMTNHTFPNVSLKTSYYIEAKNVLSNLFHPLMILLYGFLWDQKNTCIRWNCRLTPTGEYDAFIFAAAVMWPVAVTFFQTLVLVYDEYKIKHGV